MIDGDLNSRQENLPVFRTKRNSLASLVELLNRTYKSINSS